MTRFNGDQHEGQGSIMSDKFLHATRKAPSSASMLSSAKYRFREDRKRVLKLSVRKLRDIEDPETFLCRSVLINNTMKRLQQEVREEKRSSAAYNACKSYTPSPYSYFSVEKAYREEMERVHALHDENPSPLQQQQQQNRRLVSTVESFVDVDDDMASTTSTSSSSSSSSSSDEEEEDKDSKSVTKPSTSCDEVDDLLSEVYMPPSITPPTMIGSIDDDDLTSYPIELREKSCLKDNNGELCWPDRPSTPIPWSSSSTTTTSCPERSCDIWCCHPWSAATLTPAASSTTTTAASSSNCDSSSSYMSSSWSSYNSSSDLVISNSSSSSSTSSLTTTSTPSSYSVCSSSSSTSYLPDKSISEKHFSCGQSSLFGELQSVVFNSLIASLET